MTVTTANWIPKPPEVSRSRRFLLRVTGPLLVLLVGSLFLVALYESWEALQRAAEAAEIQDPRPWPYMVDGFILVMALMVVHAKQLGAEGWAWSLWAPRLGLFGATALSTAIQAGYAPHDPWLHAWSPLAVLFSFECLIRLLYGAAVGTTLAESQQHGPPAAEQTAAGASPVAGTTTQPSRLGRDVPAAMYPVVPEPSGHHGPDTGTRNLPDPPPTVTPPKITESSRPVATAWTPPTPAIDQGLRRHRENPEKFEAYIAANGLPHDEVMEMAARRNWPVANGHKEATPA